MASAPPLLLTYYADDFTGSTDALECLVRAGIRTVLFLNPPSPADLARYPGLGAIGVAGLTRSLAPDAMEVALRPAFSALRALGSRHVHYKICSTFDSSPTVGSIGRAIDLGAEIFPGPIVPLLVATPPLGRFCVFGQLFARYGNGSIGTIHRLDRHPAISHHPVTPMTEADVRLHLSHQTKKRVGLLNVLDLERPAGETTAAVGALISSGHDVLLIDGLNANHLLRAGEQIDRLADHAPLFSVGSSGIESALTAAWTAQAASSAVSGSRSPVSGSRSPASGSALTSPPPATRGLASPLLAVSGSCSPVTVEQIEWALAHGFTGIAWEPKADQSSLVAAAVAALRTGRNVVVYTHLGGSVTALPSHELGTHLGRLTRAILSSVRLTRLAVAGGDTSSYVARALGIESLEWVAPLLPGAPWCRAHATDSPVHGLEVIFKGGQVGPPDSFGIIARGHL